MFCRELYINICVELSSPQTFHFLKAFIVIKLKCYKSSKMDPDMMTKRVLTDTDLSTQGWLILPTQKIENIEKNLGFTLPRNGAQVEILDNDKSYWVNLNKNKAGYYIGQGWKSLRDERDLKTGDVIQLYWKDTKFIFSMW
ncbi:B3 domain-containing protein At1g08985-like [Brassica napus]|nr:B3 domain-containing protein At1g08985-like [Brassica napus]